MAVSNAAKTRSSQKTVLPVDADRTMVVLAQEPAPPHITQTLADCTPTQLDRGPVLLSPEVYALSCNVYISHMMHMVSCIA